LCWLLSVCAVVAGCKHEDAATPPTSQTTAERIIAYAPSSVEIIAALGAVDRLVAVGSFCNYPPEAAKLPKVGGLFNPDLEAMVKLQPDLVVMRGNNQSVQRLCQGNGITIYHDQTEDLSDIYTTIRELGALLGRREEANDLIRDMQARLDTISAAVADLPRPRVLFVVGRRDPDALASVMTAGDGTFVHEIITLAGGENIFANLAMDYPEISLEAILAARPDVIIEAMPESDPGAELEARVRAQWSSLGKMPAVEDGRVYVLTDDHTLIPSPRVVQTVATVAELLHPEASIDG